MVSQIEDPKGVDALLFGILSGLYFLVLVEALVLHRRLRRKFPWFSESVLLTCCFVFLTFMRGSFNAFRAVELELHQICLPQVAVHLIFFTPEMFMFFIFIICLLFWSQLYERTFGASATSPLLPEHSKSPQRKLKIIFLVIAACIALSLIGLLVYDAVVTGEATICKHFSYHVIPAFTVFDAVLYLTSVPATVGFIAYNYKTIYSHVSFSGSDSEMLTLKRVALLSLGILVCYLIRSVFLIIVYIGQQRKWGLHIIFYCAYWAFLEVLPLSLMQIILATAPIQPGQ